MCIVCTTLQLPGACMATTCNPVVIYEGTQLAADTTKTTIHSILGTLAGLTVVVGFWGKRILRRFRKHHS